MKAWSAVVATGLVSVAVACSSSSGSGSGGGSGSGCAGLATCCAALPSNENPSGCQQIASSGDETACNATIDGLHNAHTCEGVSDSSGASSGGASSGSSGASSSGTSSSSSGGITASSHSCTDLLSCCNSSGYPASVHTDCVNVANAGNQNACANDLTTQLIFCPQFAPDAGSGSSGGSSSSGGSGTVTCATLTACCNSANFPSSEKTNCTNTATSGAPDSVCATVYTQYKSASYCP